MQSFPSDDVPKWKIIPDIGGNFRFAQVSSFDSSLQKPLEALDSNPRVPVRFPSLTDFLHEDHAPAATPLPFETKNIKNTKYADVPLSLTGKEKQELFEFDGVTNGGGSSSSMTICGNQTFRTASGRSVTVKVSSIRKAASILQEHEATDHKHGDDDATGLFTRWRQQQRQQGLFTSSTFRSNKVVVQRSVPRVEDMMATTGLEFLFDGETSSGGLTMFQSASGRSLSTKQSSIYKGASILQENITGRDLAFPSHRKTSGEYLLCQTGSGSYVSHEEPSSNEAASICEESISDRGFSIAHHGDAGVGFPMFQTGSGKTVSIKQSSIKKALSVLGETIIDKGEMYISQDHQVEEPLQYNMIASGFSSPVEFPNTSGRSLLISHDALQRTRGLLGESGAEGSPSPISSNKNIHKNVCLPSGRFITKLPCKRKRESSVFDGDSQDMPSENCFSCEKNRIIKHHPSPFKKPRNFRFPARLSNSTCFLQSSFKPPVSKDCYRKPRMSTRYPFQSKKKTLVEYFGGPPSNNRSNLPKDIITMTPATAMNYQFHGSRDSERMGLESFQHILLRLGASPAYTTIEYVGSNNFFSLNGESFTPDTSLGGSASPHNNLRWVSNHYKWIIWKLACLERGYPTQVSWRYLTANNVLEELKYRYEREVNKGHNSAVKKILDGSASPASVVVLCVSTIYSHFDVKEGKPGDKAASSDCPKKLSSCQDGYRMKIELTDGWYPINAILDEGLSNHVLTGKLFVGQKLRLWGSGLCGWVGPVSPFEASEAVSLLINLNGTYRASWADRLGFCKNAAVPLSFNCIKVVGGPVPRVLIGISRIYPILYKERFRDGSSIVRTERMERNILQHYNERCSNIAEDITFEEEGRFLKDTDCEEGARTFQILESSAEPELLMAEMSLEKLTSINMYQQRKQADLDKKIQKAFEDAGLGSRDVTPFKKLRVVGLYSKGHPRKNQPKEGLITIWNPTEKQRFDLVEGQIYSVSGLVPLSTRSDIIYLQSRGSTEWKHTPSNDVFEPFFTPRTSVSLSNIGKVLLACEFDIAAVVLYVGEAYVSGHQRKQWIFLTDGSLSDTDSDIEKSNSLLAVCFCVPYTENDSSALTSQALLGSTVCFYNLVKRPRDQANNLWVAEATETSTYDIYPSLSAYSHLKEDALAVQKWAKISSLRLQKVKERVLEVIGSCRG